MDLVKMLLIFSVPILLIMIILIIVLRIKFQKDNEASSMKPPGENYEELLKTYRLSKERMLEAEAYRKYYNKYFFVIGEPLQRILGIVAYYDLGEQYLKYLHSNIKTIKETFGGDYNVPVPSAEAVSEDFILHARSLSSDEIKHRTENDKLDVQGCMSFKYKTIISELCSIIPQLEAVVSDSAPDLKEIQRLTEKIKLILCDNGIYPLDNKAPELSGRQETATWFSKANPGALKYPAFFIKNNNGEYKLLGEYFGSV